MSRAVGRENLDIPIFGRENLDMGRANLDIPKFGRENLDMGRESLCPFCTIYPTYLKRFIYL